MLGDQCHLINMKGWRNHPGRDASGSFHVDELFVELPESLASNPQYEPPVRPCNLRALCMRPKRRRVLILVLILVLPQRSEPSHHLVFCAQIHIVTALHYLVDVAPELCPTWVIPGSFRSDSHGPAA
eukprot:SAG11_NODE_3405_length_2466_cov_2.931559_3_plen_127_part_00